MTTLATDTISVVVDGDPVTVVVDAATIQTIEVNTTAVGPIGPQGLPGADADVTTHVADTTPHPAYDDLPSLSLLFESQLP